MYHISEMLQGCGWPQPCTLYRYTLQISLQLISMESKLIITNLMLSAATIPLIGVLLGLKAWEETTQNMGQAGEEAFRGSRLPLLNLSDSKLQR